MSAIPTSTSVSESAVIRAPLSHVWHLIKLQDFSKFWSALSGSEHVKGASEETDIVKWTFKDGSVIEVKQEEHSVWPTFLPYQTMHCSFRLHPDWEQLLMLILSQTINHYITYSVITSQPALTYTSVVSTIRCYAVTSGDLEGSTFVEYTGNFSSDADAGKPIFSYTGQSYNQTNVFPRGHPGRQVQAPRGPRRPRQGRWQAVELPPRLPYLSRAMAVLNVCLGRLAKTQNMN